MDPIIAVYNVKLTVRSSQIGTVGLTNEDVGTALEEALGDAIADLIANANEDTVTVNATSVERVDD